MLNMMSEVNERALNMDTVFSIIQLIVWLNVSQGNFVDWHRFCTFQQKSYSINRDAGRLLIQVGLEGGWDEPHYMGELCHTVESFIKLFSGGFLKGFQRFCPLITSP